MAQGFRFIHCADLHLGNPFQGIQVPDIRWQPLIEQATFRSLQQIVKVAEENKVQAVLISGDVYNSATHSLSAQLQYVRILHRLIQSGIAVFTVHGNHDPLDAWQAKVPLPAGAYTFGSDSVERVPLIVNGKEVAAIYGQSYGYSGVRENLARTFRRQSGDKYAIGMLHCQVGGHDGDYAPCTLDDLREANMDYWALGHVHTRTELCTDPPIIYPGNIQGLHSRETGPRGCYYVEVGAYGTTNIQFIETDTIRWEVANLAIDNMRTTEELRLAVSSLKDSLRQDIKHPVFLTLEVSGQGVLHGLLGSADTTQCWMDDWNEDERGKYAFVLIENIIDRTEPSINPELRSRLPDVVGDYLKGFEEIEKLSPKEQIKRLKELLEERPEWSRLGNYGRDLSDERLLTAFQRARWLGVERLLGDMKP